MKPKSKEPKSRVAWQWDPAKNHLDYIATNRAEEPGDVPSLPKAAQGGKPQVQPEFCAADMPLSEPSEPCIVDPIDLREGVENLSPNNLRDLGICARLLAWGISWSPDDLFQESIAATLEGRRRWKKGVSMHRHLCGAIRSIAWGEYRKQRNQEPLSVFEEGDDSRWHPATNLDPERIFAAKEAVQKLREALQDDPPAIDLLDLIMGGDERQAKKAIGPALYRELTIRIRRKLVVLYPDLEAQVCVKAPSARKAPAPAAESKVAAFECIVCQGKVVRTPINEDRLRWVCGHCHTGFGPVWERGHPETRLLGVQPWKDNIQDPDPGESIHVEFREKRSGETFIVWGEKRAGVWTFLERPAADMKKTVSEQVVIPRLTERAETILRAALSPQAPSDAPDESETSLTDYVRCIIEKSLRPLSGGKSKAW